MSGNTRISVIDRFVLDTNSLIYYFSDFFQEGDKLSGRARNIIHQALVSPSAPIRLSIPSIVFIEIFEKWLISEETVRQFYYSVFLKISEAENIEIRELDREVVEMVVRLEGELLEHDLHDKIVAASALVLDCPLVTSDKTLTDYAAKAQSSLKVIF